MPRTAPLANDPRFHSIQRERVSDRVAQEILRLIASGELAPGERLPGERQLAEMMDVSRVSVRAALQQLKTQGFVSAVQGGGTRVVASANPIDAGLTELVRASDENLSDLAEIRANLEIWAARRAAERADARRLRDIAQALETMADPARPARYRATDDHAFHLAIAKASGSAVYLHLMSVLGEILEKMFAHTRNELYVSESDDRRFLEQHRTIYRAIEAHDPDAAARAMRHHLDTVLSRHHDIEPTIARAAPRVLAERHA
ncbi:DNA-binding transcriptional regulator, FadR family [Tistlia consotensis]|uniref:Transcriptional regulator, GntR family n=1 Tax=Tistlia consotensis USBA 355 TaxID=560819 RepID=A0A1Y6C530_9PROT|nr:FCD domain-containing protein [Tistlia consotensis]SMF45997.1 transcriptional regulator, GntR family [Tistlia consotensis USBA 355]SNR79061.1 DNA-binding transcriptional regulator, FadR family [Tistlia consotensis]